MTPPPLSAFRRAIRLLPPLAASLLAACAGASRLGTIPPPPAAAHKALTLPNVPYAHVNGHDLQLDLHLPDTTAGGSPARPVIVFMHGGGWRVGSKAEAEKMVGIVGETGYAVASVEFRQSGENMWPAQIQDAKAAVRWLRANAKTYGLDGRRIGAMGFSGGAHLAALLGTTEGVQAFDDPALGNPGQLASVQAVCTVSAPVDLNIPTTSLIGKLSVQGLLGGSAPEKPDLVRMADPSLYVKPGLPPFLIIQGADDKLVVPAHAHKLYDALKSHGVEATLDLVPGKGHVPYGPNEAQATRDFFVRHFGPP